MGSLLARDGVLRTDQLESLGARRTSRAFRSTDEIFAEAVAGGMTTLHEDGLRLAVAGLSSLDEVRRVTGDRLS